MHFSAPRSRSGHETPSANWTNSFVPGRAVGTRWRWVLLTGTLAASVFFQVGISSNADSQKPDTDKPNTVSNVASDAESTTATTDATSADTTVNPLSGSLNAAGNALSSVLPASRTVKLSVTVDGQARTLEVTDGQNLDTALSQGGITLEKLDRVWPKLSATKVSDGLKVRIETVREKLETREEKIAPGFKYQLTTKIAPGREQLVSNGKAGVVTVTEKVVYVGGKRVRKSLVSRKATNPVQDKTIALGTNSRLMPHKIPYHKRYARAYQAERQLSARGGSPRDRQSEIAGSNTLRPIKSLTMTATGYAANVGCGTHTATGMLAVRGAIAVDPRVIPLGTKLYVEGYGYGFACDTGGAIKGNRIDLVFNSARECFQHGRRQMKVWILADAD